MITLAPSPQKWVAHKDCADSNMMKKSAEKYPASLRYLIEHSDYGNPAAFPSFKQFKLFSKMVGLDVERYRPCSSELSELIGANNLAVKKQERINNNIKRTPAQARRVIEKALDDWPKIVALVGESLAPYFWSITEGSLISNTGNDYIMQSPLKRLAYYMDYGFEYDENNPHREALKPYTEHVQPVVQAPAVNPLDDILADMGIEDERAANPDNLIPTMEVLPDSVIIRHPDKAVIKHFCLACGAIQPDASCTAINCKYEHALAQLSA
jgi:hypothetical protein